MTPWFIYTIKFDIFCRQFRKWRTCLSLQSVQTFFCRRFRNRRPCLLLQNMWRFPVYSSRIDVFDLDIYHLLALPQSASLFIIPKCWDLFCWGFPNIRPCLSIQRVVIYSAEAAQFDVFVYLNKFLRSILQRLLRLTSLFIYTKCCDLFCRYDSNWRPCLSIQSIVIYSAEASQSDVLLHLCKVLRSILQRLPKLTSLFIYTKCWDLFSGGFPNWSPCLSIQSVEIYYAEASQIYVLVYLYKVLRSILKMLPKLTSLFTYTKCWDLFCRCFPNWRPCLSKQSVEIYSAETFQIDVLVYIYKVLRSLLQMLPKLTSLFTYAKCWDLFCRGFPNWRPCLSMQSVEIYSAEASQIDVLVYRCKEARCFFL